MQPFSFQTTSSVLSEVGATSKIGKIVAAKGCRKVAFVTGKNIIRLGLAEAALDGLKKAGVDVWIFSDMVADPPEEMILQAVAQAKSEKVDAVVAVGGGSPMDTAKLIAVLANTEQPLEEMYGVGMVKGDRLPLILAPTTAGTGSEVTPISIVTTGQAQKKGVVSPQLLPDWAVLDAELTVSLPQSITAATGIDAMVHAIEAYTSKVRKNVVSDCLAKQALTLLGSSIHKACFTPEDREARSNMLLGSMLAGMAFANAPVAAVHALAYPLGGHFHVPHGLSNALVLPHVLDFNMSSASDQYADLADIIFPELANQEKNKKLDKLLLNTASLSADLGLESKLSQVGVKQSDIELLAEDAMKQTRLLVNNPREMTYDAALTIYQQAL
ncbi:MAG: iron-containing alcohol dehydrogenase [Arenicella sp.]